MTHMVQIGAKFEAGREIPIYEWQPARMSDREAQRMLASAGDYLVRSRRKNLIPVPDATPAENAAFEQAWIILFCAEGLLGHTNDAHYARMLAYHGAR